MRKRDMKRLLEASARYIDSLQWDLAIKLEDKDQKIEALKADIDYLKSENDSLRQDLEALRENM